MKKFRRISMATLASVVVFGLIGLINAAQAVASAPSMGTAADFSILANLSTSAAGAGTTISGNLGLSPGLAISRTGGPWTVGGTEYFGPLSLAANAQTDASGAFNNLAGQGSSGVWGTDPWSPTPGVYTVASDVTFTGTITLNGGYNDVWVFQVGRDMVFSGSVVLTGNAQPCNVFWKIGRDATIALGSHFVGTLIASRDVTVVSGATVNGRIMSLTSSITTDGNNITGPTCLVSQAGSEVTNIGTINVVKNVINDNGGTKTIVDFPLFINGAPVISGIANIEYGQNTYHVTETAGPGYVGTFSGQCDSSGNITLPSGDNLVCFVTNNDIGAPAVALPLPPPLIDLVKVPSPLALPNGPGIVEYTYTLRNIGTVPVTDITLVGDTCSPIVRVSGDLNNDNKLDLNETWVHKCSTTLAATHTNTVVATGWANGISTTDVAHATVIVGTPIVPPLIHVTKVPNPSVLPAGGGMVTYTKTITNPGTIPLSNVKITDDKCSPIVYVSGDLNNDSKLDTNEAWVYTCKTNITKTTLNTAVASGVGNGLTVRDFALATVVVAAPGLPKTGLPHRSLSMGARGTDVTTLQSVLEQKGFLTMPRGVAKGYFGNLTRAAVVKYQLSVGLPAVGIFGPQTQAKLIL